MRNFTKEANAEVQQTFIVWPARTAEDGLKKINDCQYGKEEYIHAITNWLHFIVGLNQ